jgi:integrase
LADILVTEGKQVNITDHLSTDEIADIIGKKLETLEIKTHLITTFSNAREALRLPCEEGKPFSEYYHRTDGTFGIRVLRPKKRTGLQTKNWIVRHRDAYGKDQKTTVLPAAENTYQEARYQAEKIRRDAASRRASGARAVPTLLLAFYQYIIARKGRWAPATLLMYKKAERHFKIFEHVRANKVTPDMLDHLIKDIKEDVAARYETFKNPTVKITGDASALEVMRIMKAVYKDLMADGTVRFTPVAKLQREGFFDRRDRKTDAIHRDDFPLFWDWLMRSTHPSVKDFILVGLFLAFRRSLIGSLTWANVDEKRRTYKIPKFAEGNKAKKEIIFPIGDFLWENVFEPRLKAAHRDPHWVIPSPKKRGKPLTSIRGSLKALKGRGITVTTHGLRRTSATLMHAATGSDLLTARLLTHRLDAAGSANSNTAGYVITTHSELRDAMNRMTALALSLAKPEGEAEKTKAVGKKLRRKKVNRKG